jgi:hypothetical protein
MSGKFHHLASAAVAAAMLTYAPSASAHGGIKIGTLACHVSSGWGYVIGSSRRVDCSFSSADLRGREHYIGSISKLGVDLGYTSGGEIVWTVFAPSTDMGRGALEGYYAGATASATIGVGIGAHALVGGFRHSIALQPLSFEGNRGFNVAAGLGQLNLRAV